MTKKLLGIALSLTILLTATAALAAVPADSLTYKTLLKTDDFYLALKTDSIAWTIPAGGETTLSLTARWGYVRPEKAVRYYPAAGPSVNWRISRVAIRYDQATGFVQVMELETALYNASGEVVRIVKNPNAGWRILTPASPDFESFDKILNYIADPAN